MNPHKNFHFWKVSLVGKEPYGLKIGDFLVWDLGAFRPDPRSYLKAGKTYLAKVELETSHLYSGKKVVIPHTIHLQEGNVSFTNMR